MAQRAIIWGGWLILVNLAVYAWAANPLEIDFHWNYLQNAARKLFETRQYQPAQDAFEQLAATAPNADARLDCLSLTAISLAYQHQIDPALEKTRAIPDPTVADYTRLEVLSIGGKQAELVAAFKAKDLAAWPETIAYKGFLKRGEAYEALKDSHSAVRDFEQAAVRAGSNPATQMDALK